MTQHIPGHGGSYAVNDAGELVQKEAPTQDHPEGNRARDADGKPLDLPPSQPSPTRGEGDVFPSRLKGEGEGGGEKPAEIPAPKPAPDRPRRIGPASFPAGD